MFARKATKNIKPTHSNRNWHKLKPTADSQEHVDQMMVRVHRVGPAVRSGLCLDAMTVCSVVLLVLCTAMHGQAVPGTASTASANRTGTLEWPPADGRAAGAWDAGSHLAEVAPSPSPPAERKLSRRKRYVAFPEGSSFSVAFCLTIGFIGNPLYSYISWSTNWGVAYDLPNETWALNRGGYAAGGGGGVQRPPVMPRPVVVRRHRRDLYERLETVIDNMGYTGKQCILRALCESSQQFGRQKSNLAVEMVKTIFSLPRTKVLPFEHPDLHVYDDAQRRGRNQANCGRLFPSCTFSLLDFALGQYMRSNSWFQ